MKITVISLVILFSGIALTGVSSFKISQAAEREEVAVEKVFVPATEYDERDSVVIRIEGALPDPCYVLEAAQVVPTSDGRTFEIHQFASRKDDGVCSGRDDLGEGAFSQDVSLGRLSAGDYRILERPSNSPVLYREFKVSRASARNLANYASVTRLSAPDAVLANQEVKIALGGVLASSCDVISVIQMERQGDVFVIRPIEARKGDCRDVPRSFENEVVLGTLPVGEYLVQVRAKNDRVIQRTFQVMSAN